MTPLAAALSEFESVDEVTGLLFKWCKKTEKTWIIPKPYLEFVIIKKEKSKLCNSCAEISMSKTSFYDV